MTSTNPSPSTLIKNAHVFDGKHETLATGMSVLIEGDKIAKFAKSITGPRFPGRAIPTPGSSA